MGIAPTDTLPQPLAAFGQEPERDLIALASCHAPCNTYQVKPYCSGLMGSDTTVKHMKLHLVPTGLGHQAGSFVSLETAWSSLELHYGTAPTCGIKRRLSACTAEDLPTCE